MALASYIPINTQTLGSAAASITFSSIPGTYTDLRLVLTCTTSVNNLNLVAQFNGDTASNYSITGLAGTGAAASSSYAVAAAYLQFTLSGQTSSTIPQMYLFDVFSYTGATNKTSLMASVEDNNGSGWVETICGLWRSTAAITSIVVKPVSNTFATGTIATLWGI